MKITYIMSRFPHLPETFILREMTALDKKGIEISLYPLIFQKSNTIHKDAQKWIKRAEKTPYLSFKYGISLIQYLIKKPIKFFLIILKTISQSISNPSYLFRVAILFPKATYFAKRFEQENIEHIHVHYATYPAYVAWVINELTSITYSITVHAHDIFVHQTMLKTKFAKASKIIAISQFNKEFIIQNIDESLQTKIEVIHCGIQPKAYQNEFLPYNQTKPFQILSIGSLQPYKGQIYLIKACQQLQENGYNIQCNIVGSGELHQKLQAYINENQVQNVTLIGPKREDQIIDFLKKHHLYVQPSIITPSGKMEGIPVALMEAMASQTLVLASNLSGIPELVIANQTGFLVEQKDPNMLAQKIVQIINHYQKYSQITNQAEEKIKSEYNLETNSDILLQQFVQIAKGR